VTQHAGLDANRWRGFSLEQQILMIANEMNRASKLLDPADAASRRLAYERVLRLVDLTIEVQTRKGLRRELLRWRDLAAVLYLGADPDPVAHRAALHALLLLNPIAARQREHIGR
jgi:hypothetical protein